MRLFVLSMLMAALAAVSFAQTPDCSLVPGWKQQGPARLHDADNLFEYMDGNAEGYIVYRLVNMRGVNCESAAGTLVFDVFEMAGPEWAYGVFAANRDRRVPAEKVGVLGQVVPRQAIFVKDKYFAQISIDRDQPEIVRQFALALAKKIPGTDEPPAALTWFPTDKLAADSIRMVPESVLGIRALKRGYIAEYEFGKAFLILDDSPEAAADSLKKALARISDPKPVKLGDEAYEADDKYLGRLCIFRKGRYIGGFNGVKEGVSPVAASATLAEKVSR